MAEIETWQDVRDLVRIADSYLEKQDKKKLSELGEEEYYTEILEEYKRIKKG